jgi:hypothetical protein
MLFICRDKGRRIVVSAERQEMYSTKEGVHGSSYILFRPWEGKGFVTSALPRKGMRERAEGFFESENPNYRPGLTQEEAERFLANHKDYGREFVAIGKKGETLGSGEWLDPGKRSEAPGKRSEAYLTPSGAGVFCQLCDRQLENRGLSRHITSKKHVEFLEKAEEEGLPRYAEAEG